MRNSIDSLLIKLQVQKVQNPQTAQNTKTAVQLTIPNADSKMRQLNDLLLLQITLRKHNKTAMDLLRKYDSLVPETKRSFTAGFGFTGAQVFRNSKLRGLKILDSNEIRNCMKDVCGIVSKILNLMIKLTNGANPEKDIEDTTKQQEMVVQKSLYSAFEIIL